MKLKTLLEQNSLSGISELISKDYNTNERAEFSELQEGILKNIKATIFRKTSFLIQYQ